MEVLSIGINDAAEWDRIIAESRANDLPDDGALKIITKDGAMQSGRAGVMLTFGVQVNGKIVRVQTVQPLRSLLAAFTGIASQYTEDGYRLSEPVRYRMDG